jgi:hypothetical protein
MKTDTTCGLIALSMENPALEFENFDRVVKQYIFTGFEASNIAPNA